MLQSLARFTHTVSWTLVGLTVLLILFGAFTEPLDADAQSQEVPPGQSYLPDAGQSADNSAMMARKRAKTDDNWTGRAISFMGIFGFIGLAWLMSNNKRRVKWKLVFVGTSLQVAFAVFILWTPIGKAIFGGLNEVVSVLLNFTKSGSDFLFQSFVTGNVEVGMVSVAFTVLPTIIFFSSLMTVLYYFGVMQTLVRWMSALMIRFMGTSGSETLSASANIFVGQTEAPLVIKPYVATMTQSELMAVMTGGFATVAGGVLAAYVAILSPYFPDIAGHLIAASVMSAPAALVIAKIMIPEVEESKTMGKVELETEQLDVNAIDAAARGAGEGLFLSLNVGAMLLAFIALVAMLNYGISLPSRLHNEEAFEEVRNYMVSATLPAPPGCEDMSENDDILRCTHSGLLTLADAHQLGVPDDLLELQGDEEAKIKTVETLGAFVHQELEPRAHPLEGTAALHDCEAGRVSACGAVLTVTQSERWQTELSSPDLWPFITLEFILGWIFFPIALLMGVPLTDCHLIGQILGEKMVLNEFLAYLHLAEVLPNLQYRSIVIATYALCGFANFSSIAIQIGGIGGIAPSRKRDLAKLGMRAMIAGTIAAFMTATIAGALLN